MDRGKIAEVGSHDELINNKGNYYSMWETYSQAQLWRIGGENIG
jgi:ABC-type multidrug transport system fused ATPase/permease subunit